MSKFCFLLRPASYLDAGHRIRAENSWRPQKALSVEASKKAFKKCFNCN